MNKGASPGKLLLDLLISHGYVHPQENGNHYDICYQQIRVKLHRSDPAFFLHWICQIGEELLKENYQSLILPSQPRMSVRHLQHMILVS